MIETARQSLENGIREDWLADTAAQIHARIVLNDIDRATLNDPGWKRVAAMACDHYFESAAAVVQRPIRVLAESYLRAWCDEHGIDAETTIKKESPAGGPMVIAFAWVARWLAFAVQTESQNEAAEACDLVVSRGQQEIVDDANGITRPGAADGVGEAQAGPAQESGEPAAQPPEPAVGDGRDVRAEEAAGPADDDVYGGEPVAFPW